MRYLIMALGAALVLQVTPAHAQLGKLFKEGLKAAGKKAMSGSSKAAKEGSEQLLKKSATTAARKVGQEAAESAAKQSAGAAVRNSDGAVKALALHGAAIATPILSRFGDDGAKALSKLSSTNARRMAMLTDELSAAGRGADFMRVLAERGDVAANWIWKNKGTIAVGTTAVAFLSNPDAFLQAGEAVVTKSVEAAGEHVAEPLIDGTTKALSSSVDK